MRLERLPLKLLKLLHLHLAAACTLSAVRPAAGAYSMLLEIDVSTKSVLVTFGAHPYAMM